MTGAIETLMVRLKAEASQYNVVMDKAVEKLRGTAKRMAEIQQKLASLDKRLADQIGKSLYNLSDRTTKLTDRITKNLVSMQDRLQMTMEAARKGASVNEIMTSLGHLDKRMAHTIGLMGILEKQTTESINNTLSQLSNKSAIELAKINNQIAEFSKGLRYLGYRMTLFVTLPLVGMGAAFLKTFSDFDKAMTSSTAIMQGLNDETKEMMKQQAFSISSKSTTGIVDLANAYYDLTSAGLDAAQSIGALPVVEKFAVAGNFEMSKATDMLATAQAALGMRLEDPIDNMREMVRITDVLTKADITANASVEEFATALVSKSGAALRLNNKTLEEGVAILAAYADQGVKGELGGERLAIMLRDLQTASINNRTEWSAMGIAVFDSGGKMRKIADIIEDLEGRMAGATDEQKKMMLMQLGFTDRSVHAVSSLIGVSDAIREYEGTLLQAAGTTEEVANKQLKSFAAQWTMLKNKIDIVSVQLGEVVAPILAKINGLITVAVEWFQKLNKPMKLVVITIGALIAAAGPVMLVIGLIGGAVSGIISGIMALTTVIGSILAFLTPALPVIAAIAAFGAAIMAVLVALSAVAVWIMGPDGVYNAFWKVTEAVQNFVKKAIGFMMHFKENMVILFLWLRNNWALILLDVGKMILTFFKNFKHNAFVAIETAQRLFFYLMGVVAKMMTNAFNYIFSVEMIKAVALALGELLGMFAQFAQEQGDLLMRMLRGDFRPEANFLAKYIEQLEKDAEKGFSSPDFLGGAKEILAEQFGKLHGPLTGMRFSTPSPGFNFGDGAGADEKKDPLGGVKKRLEEIKEETETPITIRFRVTGIDAVRAGTAEARRLLEAHRSTFRSTTFMVPSGASPGIAGGGPVATTGARYSDRDAGDKQLELLSKIADNTRRDNTKRNINIRSANV